MTRSTSTAVSEERSASTAAPRGRRGLRLLIRAVYAAVVLGLIGFNAWWFWRDTRSVADLRTISGWFKTQRYDEARGALEEHLRRSPYDGEARILYARLLAARGDILACARQLGMVPSWWPGRAEALLHQGQAYLEVGHAREAELAWKECVRDDPLHPVPGNVFHDACLDLIKIYALEDRWDDAKVIMWLAYDHADADDQERILMMRIRSELERVAPKEAIPTLRRYIAADPKDWQALRALARDEQSLGQSAEALRHIQACVEATPDDPRVWRDYFAMLQEQGEIKTFLERVEKTPKATESDPEIWKYRGMAREKASDWEGAAPCYREALKLNPFGIEYLYRLGMAEQRLGQRAEAATHRNRSHQLSEARRQLSAVFEDFLQAREHKQQGGPGLVESIRRLAATCETLGWVRAAQGWEGVARRAAEAERAQPQDAARVP